MSELRKVPELVANRAEVGSMNMAGDLPVDRGTSETLGMKH